MKIRLLAFAFALLFGSPAFAASPTIEVWKSTTCECCGYWVKHDWYLDHPSFYGILKILKTATQIAE